MLSYYRFDGDGVGGKTVGSQRKWAPTPADWIPCWSECLQLSSSPFNRLSKLFLPWPSSVLDFLPLASPAHQPIYDSVQIWDWEYSPFSVIEEFKAYLPPPQFSDVVFKGGHSADSQIYIVPHSNHLWHFHQCLIKGELFFPSHPGVCRDSRRGKS